MNYLKQRLSERDTDHLRINLSVKEDALTAEPGDDYPQRVSLSKEPSCDWCGDPPTWGYFASQTSTGERVKCMRWCACERCSRMIEQDDWSSIERLATARFKHFLGPKLKQQYGLLLSEPMITEAVRRSLQMFHDFAIMGIDAEPGTGKTKSN